MTAQEYTKKVFPKMADSEIEKALEKIDGIGLFQQDPILFEKRFIAYFKKDIRKPYIKE